MPVAASNLPWWDDEAATVGTTVWDDADRRAACDAMRRPAVRKAPVDKSMVTTVGYGSLCI
jgi:hypothetical protein